MSVWKEIYRAIARTIKEEDKSFELSFLRFGEAREWLVQHVNLSPDWLVLEIGYGQGYLTMELASSLRRGKVIGIDLLNELGTTHVTRRITKKLGLEKRIALVNSDSTKLPFRDATFDAVASFLALQDI